MDVVTVSRQESQINNVLLFANGFASALTHHSQVSTSQLSELEKLVDKLIQIVKKVEPNVRRVVEKTLEESDDAIRVLLLGTREIVESLRLFVTKRPEILRSSPGLVNYWTEQHQRTLERNLDLFEEAEETLALSLNPSFINEIEDARREAGVKTDGAAALPTR